MSLLELIFFLLILQKIALRDSGTSPEERVQLLRTALKEFCEVDESIAEDPLYRIVSDLTGGKVT